MIGVVEHTHIGGIGRIDPRTCTHVIACGITFNQNSAMVKAGSQNSGIITWIGNTEHTGCDIVSIAVGKHESARTFVNTTIGTHIAFVGIVRIEHQGMVTNVSIGGIVNNRIIGDLLSNVVTSNSRFLEFPDLMT